MAAIGLEGVVVGANRLSGELDERLIERLVNHAQAADLKVTLHRSFDLVPDPLTALTLAQSLAIDTILTSGCAPSAIEGVHVIAELITYLESHPATPRVEIMAGVGIHAQNVGEIVRNTGVRAVHGSCSQAATVTSGASDFGYADHRRTDRQRIVDLREALAPFHAVAAQ
ncbi:Copper homeostasis protein CutC (plasmid) [Asticcacaulis sp. MM231]